jgi:hypothetical protein
MYVALANFAYAGRTYFVGDEIHLVEVLLKNGMIGYSEEIEEDVEDGSIQSD